MLRRPGSCRARRYLLLAPALMALGAGKPAHLTCDSLDHPLGIDSSQPLLSWQLQDPGFGARQSAYRIEVATRPAVLSGSQARRLGQRPCYFR